VLLWKNVIPGPNPPDIIYALVECPKGSRNKYELSKTANLIILDRPLHSSVLYPHDYGLIPGTYADDDDPLDILVLASHANTPLTIIKAKPIGVLLMSDEKGLDEKILAVSIADPVFSPYTDILEIPKHYLNEIQEFFRTYKNLEHPKYADVKEWQGVKEANQIITQCIANFKYKYGDVATLDPAK